VHELTLYYALDNIIVELTSPDALKVDTDVEHSIDPHKQPSWLSLFVTHLLDGQLFDDPDNKTNVDGALVRAHITLVDAEQNLWALHRDDRSPVGWAQLRADFSISAFWHSPVVVPDGLST
jgi:hypothetical protein